MKKNILLVNPWIYDFSAYDFGIRPLGLLRIARKLVSEHNVCLIDCLSGCARSKRRSGFSKFKKVELEKPEILKHIERPYFRYGISQEAFKERLSEIPKPDAVYVSSGMTYWYPGVKAVISILRKFFPKTTILLGGIYATLCPEHARLQSGADHIWQGDYLTYDEIDSKLPMYELIDDKSMLPIWTTRGCPYRCSYCASGLINPYFIRRDPIRVFEEIMHYKKAYNTRTFVFYDDALFYKPNTHIKKLLRIIMASGEKFSFQVPNGVHARFIDEELSYLLKATGFNELRLSLETSNEKIKRYTGNKVRNKDLKKAVLLLKEAGFEKDDVGVYIMTGAPWLDTYQTKKDILFVHSVRARAILASYSPIPGTVDHELLLEEGIIEKNMDPLWHNKAIFSEKLMPGSMEEIRILRRFNSKLNA